MGQGPWRPWSWTWQGQGGEGMDSCDQAGTIGEGRQDQVFGGDLPLLSAQMAGIEDCYTSAKGSTGTLGNFAKATYAAIAETYSYLTPDLWKETVFTKSPYQEFTDFLAKNHRAAGVQKQEARAY